MVSAEIIAKLRAQTGAGMMDCKNALEETSGDVEKAIEILRAKGLSKAAKRADKIAAEGLVSSYIHMGGKVGVLVEVNCETDFVAKTDGFKELVADIALHIAASSPLYITAAEVPTEMIEKEKSIYREQLKEEGKPEAAWEKILEGKLKKFFSEVCLLDQAFVKSEEGQTIAELLVAKTASIGEKITIRRFVRFALGEGIVKETTDFAAEVAAQVASAK